VPVRRASGVAVKSFEKIVRSCRPLDESFRARPCPSGKFRHWSCARWWLARGMAHIGVLKVLERRRIPVRLVTGTSVGALIGAAYCSGLPLEDLEKVAHSCRSPPLPAGRSPAMASPRTTAWFVPHPRFESEDFRGTAHSPGSDRDKLQHRGGRSFSFWFNHRSRARQLRVSRNVFAGRDSWTLAGGCMLSYPCPQRRCANGRGPGGAVH